MPALPVVVTRPTNNFGSFQFSEQDLPLGIINLLNGGQFPLCGCGRHEGNRLPSRSWRWVASELSADASGEIYNVGTGNETPNRVLAAKISALPDVSGARRLRGGPGG